MEAAGSSSIRDATVLGVLAFLQRLEYSRNNGRKRSRAFIDFLRGFYMPAVEAEPESAILLPGNLEPGDLESETPRIIL